MRRVNRELALVLGLAAFLRLALFAVSARHPGRFWSPDDRDYLPLARHLHAAYLTEGPGRLFVLGLRRPPVYPLFLRGIFEVFGNHYAAVVAVQLVLGVATVALAYRLAGLVLPRPYALLAALFVALDPASIVFAHQMLTETLFTFLLTLALVLLVDGWRSGRVALVLCAGLLLGVATLTRPVSAYLPIVLLLCLLVPAGMRRFGSPALVVALLVGFALPVGGWVIRNAAATGVPIVSTIEGYNMLHYRAVGALNEDGTVPYIARREAHAEVAAQLPPHANAAQVSREQLKVGLRILARHPVGAFQSWLHGEERLLGGPAKSETASLLTGTTALRPAWLRALVLAAQMLTLVLVGAAAVGAACLVVGRLHAPELWTIGGAALYLIVISGGPEAYSRFRVPVAPLLAVFAAASVACAARSARRLRP